MKLIIFVSALLLHSAVIISMDPPRLQRYGAQRNLINQLDSVVAGSEKESNEQGGPAPRVHRELLPNNQQAPGLAGQPPLRNLLHHEDSDSDSGNEQDFQQALEAIAQQEQEEKQNAERVERRKTKKNRFTRFLIPNKRKVIKWPQPCPYYEDHPRDHNNEHCTRQFLTLRHLEMHCRFSHDLLDIWRGKYTDRYFIVKK